MELISYWPIGWLLGAVGLLVMLRYTLVDRPRGLMLASLGLRCLAIVLLALALCRPFLRWTSRDLHVVFLVDVSQSVELAQARDALDDVSQAIEALQAGDSWSLYALARGVRPFASVQAFREVLDQWEAGAVDEQFRSATELGHALSAVRLALPAGKVHRIVLLSDGRPTDQATEETLALLREEQVDVRFRSVPGLQAAEAAVVSLDTSSPVAFEHEVVRLTARVIANTAMSAKVNLLLRGVIIATQQIQLTADQVARVGFDVPMEVSGPTVWQAEIVPEQDRYAINNTAECIVTVRGDARVLAIHKQAHELRPFARALQQQGFSLDVREPSGLPRELNKLLEFDAVILSNVAATEISMRQQQMLQRYVTDFGGGLAMMGSENSFGLGGYYKSPVEQVLPLISRFEKEREKPSLAMALVIDKSGSMEGMPIMLARQAAKATVELLSPRDQIAVVAFDGSSYIVSEMRNATDIESIKIAIDGIGAGGGTFMYSGMIDARNLLQSSVAKIKHMIVLSDGQTQAADHEGLVAELADMGVTVSTVGLGPGADQALLSRLAEQGRGRFYHTLDPASVPQIFTRETMHASRSAIKEDLTMPVQVTDHPTLAGYETTQLPFVLGYVMTQPRPASQVVLATEAGDPLLAVSRFGLGVGMAYTSDMTQAWGGEWLAWEDCGIFWAQVLRFLARKSPPQGIMASATVEDERWVVDIKALDERDAPLTDLVWDAKLIDEQNQSENVAVRTVGLGRYQTRLPLQGHDQLTLRLHASYEDALRVLHYQRPYPAEYALYRQPDAGVERLLPFETNAVRADLQPVGRRRSMQPLLVLGAITALLGSVLLRRI